MQSEKMCKNKTRRTPDFRILVEGATLELDKDRAEVGGEVADREDSSKQLDCLDPSLRVLHQHVVRVGGQHLPQREGSTQVRCGHIEVEVRTILGVGKRRRKRKGRESSLKEGANRSPCNRYLIEHTRRDETQLVHGLR